MSKYITANREIKKSISVRKLIGLAMLMLLFSAMAAACGAFSAQSTPTPTHTAVPPPDTPLPPTDTPVPTATDTPEPTATETATPTETPTDTPTPTPDFAATEAAEATATAEVLLAEIMAELEELKVSTAAGSLAWAGSEAIDLTISAYNTERWYPLQDGKKFTNFVLKTEITWESTGGLAICGIVLRSETDDIGFAEHYKFQTIRLSGLPSWDVELWRYGRWQSTTSGTIRSAPTIKQDNGSTNEFILIADGSTLTIYGNGARLGTVVISKLSSGLVGYYAWQESGATTCSFGNSWLWLLD